MGTSDSPRRVRVFVVDDSAAFSWAATNYLGEEPLIDVVGTAPSAEEGIAQVPTVKPDVVLVDFRLPKMDGLEAIRRLKAIPDPPAVVMVTSHSSHELRDAALDHGADGFVGKEDFVTDAVKVILQVGRKTNGNTGSE